MRSSRDREAPRRRRTHGEPLHSEAGAAPGGRMAQGSRRFALPVLTAARGAPASAAAPTPIRSPCLCVSVVIPPAKEPRARRPNTPPPVRCFIDRERGFTMVALKQTRAFGLGLALALGIV